MTLQIKSTDTISGIPIKQVRSFFRHVVCWHKDSFELPWLKNQLSLDEKSAIALASELSSQGYVEALPNSAYKITDKGGELVRASAAGKIGRKTAQTALAGLLERAKQYNSDADKVLTIDVIVVFGSFLGKMEKLGDLDIAVKYHDRNVNNRAEAALAYARRSNRHFGTFFDELCWPNTELRQILKARKRTISIQEWDSFLNMTTTYPDRFQYEVVFGSSEEVGADIRTRRGKNID